MSAGPYDRGSPAISATTPATPPRSACEDCHSKSSPQPSSAASTAASATRPPRSSNPSATPTSAVTHQRPKWLPPHIAAAPASVSAPATTRACMPVHLPSPAQKAGETPAPRVLLLPLPMPIPIALLAPLSRYGCIVHVCAPAEATACAPSSIG